MSSAVLLIEMVGLEPEEFSFNPGWVWGGPAPATDPDERNEFTG